MATLNLGRIKPVFRGAYSGSTAYVVDDIVTSGGSSYICIQAHGAGTQAVNQTAYWTLMAEGGDVASTLTTQGDVLYRDGSGLQRLAKGTAAQVLKMNTAANAPEWADAAGGKTLQVQTAIFTTGVNINNGNFGTGAWAELSSPMSIAITPQKSTSKIYVEYNPHIFGHNNGGTSWDNMKAQLRYKYSSSSPTSYTLIPNNKGDGYWGGIMSNDYSGLSGSHWLSAKPFLTCMHDHDTPTGETITYTMYARSASNDSYDWIINGYTDSTGNNGVGRIRVTELDI